MLGKWVGNGPVTNTGGGTGAEKGAARWSWAKGGARRVLLMKKQMQIIYSGFLGT